jgi:hypothetical protein
VSTKPIADVAKELADAHRKEDPATKVALPADWGTPVALKNIA